MPSGGSGTASDPYQLANLADLNDIRNDLNAYYILTADIDASGTSTSNSGAGWDPIWNFAGELDGDGFTIDALQMDRPGEAGGFFGEDGTGTILNLGLTNAGISFGGRGGGLVGFMDGGTVDNCYITGSVDGGNDADSSYTVGGLIGLVGNSASVINSYSEASVVGVPDTYNTFTAGFVGSAFGGAGIENCYATGPVDGHGSKGGFVGNSDAAGTSFTDCYSTGTVGENIAAPGDVGGFGAYASNGVSVTRCYTTSTLFPNDHVVGGFWGNFNGSSISQCFAKNDIPASGYDNVGGLIGTMWDSGCTVEDAYAWGDVTGRSQVGGVVGYVGSGVDYNARVYASGAVSGSGSNIGGILGTNNSLLEDSYWDTETTGQTNPVGWTGGTQTNVTGLTTSEMTGDSAADNMAAFDFDAVWLTTGTYPQFQWQDIPLTPVVSEYEFADDGRPGTVGEV